jgi:hypothetical protein
MSTLTQFFPKSSELPIGALQVVAGGLFQAPATITAADGSVWLRDNALYPISEYPEAAKVFYGAGGAFTFSSNSFQPSATVGAGIPKVVLFGNNKVFTATLFNDCQRSTNGTNSLQNFAVNGSIANSINAGSYGSGRFVVGGDANAVATSTDLITWTTVTGLLNSSNIDSVAAGNNVWMASVTAQSSSGTNMARSTNGTTWANITSPWNSGSRCITFGDGKFVAVNRYGRVEYSTDGLTWTGPNLLNGNSGDRYCNAFAYANGSYVGVGDNQAAGTRGMIITSPDGKYWTSRNTSLNLVYNTVTYGAGRWVAGASNGWIATSTDAITWSTQTVGASFTINSIVYTDKFIAAGSGGNIRTSTDGLTWTARTSGVASGINAMAKRPSDNQVVYVGDNGLLGYSTDGITWVNNFSGNAFNGATMSKIAYGNGIYLATGPSTRIMKSTDGISWSVSTPVSAIPDYADLGWIAFNDQTNLFGVHFIDAQRYDITMYTSTDGNSWVTKTTQAGISSGNTGAMRLFGWSCANGKFIGITDWSFSGGIYMTANGDGWNHLPYIQNSTTAYISIAYGGGRWVVASVNSNLYTSTDLESWEFVQPPLETFGLQSQAINKVEYNSNSGLWMYCGNRMLGCSTDGISWRPLAQNNGNISGSQSFSGYNWLAAGLGSSWYVVGSQNVSTTTGAFWGYTPDPTIPYAVLWDASEYFYVPKISQSTYTLGTTSTGTQVASQAIATNNTEAIVYVKGK